MRIVAVFVVAAAVGVVAANRSPEEIVYARVSPNPGGLGVFIATADGGNERALLSAPTSLRSGVCARRRQHRLYIGP